MDDLTEGQTLIDETDWYRLIYDEDGFYTIEQTPYAPEDAPMVDIEGSDITSVTYGALFYNTWDELDDLISHTARVMEQLSQLEDAMREDASTR